uniref:tetratricopeptide repeat protein n=2 Tax=Proteus TaxID=583 RepID=UPI003F687A98
MNFILNCKFRFCLLFILFLSFHSIANDDYNKKSNNLITEAQLVEDPTLLLRLFIPALIRNDVEGVGLLLSIYEKQKKQEDDELLIWGNAIIARKNKQLDKSISLYRSLVSKNPKLIFARLQLAIALFENKENEAALEQFDKLKSENLNDNVIDIINKYSELINHQNDWSFNGGIVYLNESNINNSPKLGVNTANWKSTSKPESAEGFSYVGVAEKKLSIYKNYFSLLNFRGKGKYYWDNSKYNEISSRV